MRVGVFMIVVMMRMAVIVVMLVVMRVIVMMRSCRSARSRCRNERPFTHNSRTPIRMISA